MAFIASEMRTDIAAMQRQFWPRLNYSQSTPLNPSALLGQGSKKWWCNNRFDGLSNFFYVLRIDGLSGFDCTVQQLCYVHLHSYLSVQRTPLNSSPVNRTHRILPLKANFEYLLNTVIPPDNSSHHLLKSVSPEEALWSGVHCNMDDFKVNVHEN